MDGNPSAANPMFGSSRDDDDAQALRAASRRTASPYDAGHTSYGSSAADAPLSIGGSSRAVSNSSWLTSTYTATPASVYGKGAFDNQSQASTFSNTFGVETVPIQPRFSAVVEEDDLYNTKVELDGRGNQNDMFLRPGKYDSLGQKIPDRPPGCKGFCCGTPRRKFGCYTLSMFLLAYLFFLVARAIDAFKILGMEPQIAELGVVSLCDSALDLSISLDLDNPSSITADLGAMQSELWIDDELVGVVDSGGFEFKTGPQKYVIPMKANFVDGQVPHVQEIVQRFVSGEDIPFKLKLPISAKFAPRIFLIPLTLPLQLNLESKIRGLGFEYENPKPIDPNEYEPQETIQSITLMHSNQPTPDDWLVAKIGLNLFPRASLKEIELNLILPQLTLSLFVEGKRAAVIQTYPFHVGRPEAQPEGYDAPLGTLFAKAAITWDDVPGINEAVERLFLGPDVTIKLIGGAINTPDMSTAEHERNFGEQCFMQTLIDGLVYEDVLPVFDYETPTTKVDSEYEFPELLEFRKLELKGAEQGYLQLRVGAGVQGLLNFAKLSGPLPKMALNVSHSNAATGNQMAKQAIDPVDVAYVELPNLNEYVLDQENDHLEEVKVFFHPYTINKLLHLAEDIVGGAETYLGIRTDPTYSVLSGMLSGFTFVLPMHQYEYEAEFVRQRAVFLNQTVNDDPQFIRLEVDSDEEFLEIQVNATTINTETLGGIHIILPELEYRMDIWDEKREAWERVLYFYMAEFDSGFTRPDLKAFIQMKDNRYNGELLRDMVFNVTDLEEITCYGHFYQPPGFKRFQGEFDVLRAPSDPFVPQNAKADAVAATDTSGFKLWHIELWEVKDSEITAVVNFGLDLGQVVIEVHLPKIAVSFKRCDADEKVELVAVIVDPWQFTSGANTSIPVGVNIAPRNSSEVVETMRELTSSVDATEFCMSGHPTEGNFLSYMLGSLELDIAVGGESEGPSRNLTESITIGDFTLESPLGGTTTCADIDAIIDTSTIDGNATSFGWGDLNTHARHEVINTGIAWTSWLHLVLDAAYVGPSEPYNVANFGAPPNGGSSVINGRLCMSKDPNGLVDVDEGAAVVREVFQRVLDEVDINVGMDGSLMPRITIDNLPAAVETISALFKIPGNLIPALTSSAAANDIDSETVTDWFAFRTLEFVEWNQNLLTIEIGLETGDLGFLITLPQIRARISSQDRTAGKVQTDLFEVYATVPPFGKQDFQTINVQVQIEITDYGDLFDFGSKIMNNEVDIVLGYSKFSGANFLSKCIPEIVFALGELDELEEAPTEETFKFEARVSSSPTVASLKIIFEALVEFETLFIIDQLDFDICAGNCDTETVIGEFHASHPVNMKAVGSGLNFGKLDLYAAEATVADVFEGRDTDIGFDGMIGSKVFKAHFTFPASFLEPAAVSTDAQDTVAQDAIRLEGISLLGGDNVGTDAVFPCILDGVCENLLRSVAQSNLGMTGLTVGVMIGLDFSELITGLVWDLYLDDDVWITIAINGFVIGKVALRSPLHVSNAHQSLNPIVSVFLTDTADNIEVVRASLTLLGEGWPSVITVRGAADENYLSKLASQVVQDIESVDGDPLNPDPNAPNTDIIQGSIVLQLRKTVRKRADLGVIIPFLWDAGDLSVFLGDFHAHVAVGHADNGGVGTVIGGATNDVSPLILTPNPNPFTFTVGAYAEYEDGSSPDTLWEIGKVIGKVLFKIDIQLEIDVDITPPASQLPSEWNTAPFNIQTHMTIIQTMLRPEFLDPDEPSLISGVEVDILGTIGEIFDFDFDLVADVVIQNTLDFPILISYIELGLGMVDLDGVRTGGCNGISGGISNSLNVCAWLGSTCGGPWWDSRNLEANGNLIKAGNRARPAGTALNTYTEADGVGGGKVYHVPVLEFGAGHVIVDTTIPYAGRLVDEFLVKETLCGDLFDATLVVGITANTETCSDGDNTSFNNLQCTFVGDIPFELLGFPFSILDNCGFFMPIPFEAGYAAFKHSGVYQHGALTNEFTLTSGGDQQQTRWDQGGTLPVNDPFRVTFRAKVTGGCVNGKGEAFSFMMRQGYPFAQNAPTITDVDCGILGCDARYAYQGVGSNSIGFIFAHGGCNAFALGFDGSPNPQKASQSCVGSQIEDGNWNKYTITYDNVGERIELRMSPASGSESGYSLLSQPSPKRTGRVYEFDFKASLHLNGADHAYLGFGASTGYWQCATQSIRDFRVETVRSDSLKTTSSDVKPVLPVAGAVGIIQFQATDSEGRFRGTGGNTWEGQLYTPAGVEVGSAIPDSKIEDLGNGRYNLEYTAPARGRYVLKVRCLDSSGAFECANWGQWSEAIDGIFIRDPVNRRRRQLSDLFK